MGKIENITKEEIISLEDQIVENCMIQREKKVTKNLDIMDKTYGRFIVTGKEEVLIKKIVEFMQGAKDSICLSSFILTEMGIINELKSASKRGVRVYILTAPEMHLVKENPEVDIQKGDFETHKKILNELASITLIRTAPHLHSKFVLVDPKTENAKGILSTANLTERELTQNPDIGVILDQSEIKDLFKQFIRAFWMESEREILEKGSLSAIGESPYSEKQLILPSKILVTMKNVNSLKENLNKFIDKLAPSSDEIIVSIYSILSDYSLTKKLLSLTNNGLKTTVLTRLRSINLPALVELQKSGAQILIHDRVHAKVLVAKSNKCESILMTANFSELGLETGFESGIKFNTKDSEDLLKILSSWCEVFPYEFYAQKQLKSLPDQVFSFDSKEGKMIYQIKSKTRKKLDNLRASSIELMGDMKPTKFPQINVKGELFRKCIYEWEIEAPKLPAGAKLLELDTKSNLDVYSTKKAKFVVITDTKDLKKAEKIAKEIGCTIVLPQ